MMPETVTISGVAVGVFTGGAAVMLLLNRLYVPRSELDPKALPTRTECAMRHEAVDAALHQRSVRHHDLANEMQSVKMLVARVDKRLAVLSVTLAAMAKHNNIPIPDDDGE